MSSAICFTRPLRWKIAPKAWRRSSKSASRSTRTDSAHHVAVNLQRDASAFAAPCERRAHQRAVNAFGKGRGPIEAKPRQAFPVGHVRTAREALPQQSGQILRRSLRILQPLQSRDQPLLEIREITAERK